eukprot:GHVP01035409.1.p1 GENE.GHVP01035409.1~~GHVP01035409.1.p1  ORF type:complete len:198 (-),score=21.98 GHVP01035409.1:311-904(-)
MVPDVSVCTEYVKKINSFNFFATLTDKIWKYAKLPIDYLKGFFDNFRVKTFEESKPSVSFDPISHVCYQVSSIFDKLFAKLPKDKIKEIAKLSTDEISKHFDNLPANALKGFFDKVQCKICPSSHVPKNLGISLGVTLNPRLPRLLGMPINIRAYKLSIVLMSSLMANNLMQDLDLGITQNPRLPRILGMPYFIRDY